VDRVCAPAFECISEIELDERPELFASLAVAYNFDGIPRLGRHPSQHYRHVFRGEAFLPLRSKKTLPSRHLATHFCLAPNQLPQSRQREE